MTTFQKVIKYLAMALALCLVVGILGGILSAVGIFGGLYASEAVLEETKVYGVQSQIRSLEVRVNAADLSIKQAEAFSVESNLKYLAVSENNGVLTVKEERKYTSTYTDATLTICIPTGTVFEEVSIVTGAAKLSADQLSAETLKLQLGAGDVKIENLNASGKADIEGGAGKITVAAGTLNDLELEMGVGELKLTAALLGNSDLNLGVGKSDLTLLGGRENYQVDIEKGIGSITVDGKTVSDFVSGNGENRVEIEGGIGAIALKFQNTESL